MIIAVTDGRLMRAWRKARRGARTEIKPVDLTEDAHTPTRGTRILAVATLACLGIVVIAMGGRRGDAIAPDWVIGSAGGAVVVCAVVCAVVWAVLYRRARATGRTREQR